MARETRGRTSLIRSQGDRNLHILDTESRGREAPYPWYGVKGQRGCTSNLCTLDKEQIQEEIHECAHSEVARVKS